MALTKIGIDAIEGAIGTAQLEDNAVTTGKIAAGAVGTTDLADSAVTLAKTDNLFVNTQFSGTESIKVPAGTTAQRPVSPAVGMIRYNTTNEVLEQYGVDGWVGIEPSPTISSVTLPGSQTAVDAGDTITINGTGFKVGASVKFIHSGGTQYTSPTVSRISSTQLTAEITSGAAEGTYQLVVNNPSGLGATYDNAFNVDGVPIFTTASGSLGTQIMETPFSATIQASEDSATPTFALITGSLPAGVSLNTSTGVISGTLSAVESDTTYNFTIRATDAENQTSTRNFSITVLYVYNQTNSVLFG